MPKIDFFASSLSHQIPQFFAWKPDPFIQRADVIDVIGYYRSAISAFHDYVDWRPIGQHPEVCVVVSGMQGLCLNQKMS